MYKKIAGQNMRALYYNLFIIKLIVASILISTEVAAQGNLLIMPPRVVFDGSKRFEELNLANAGRDTARYLVSMIQIRMKENGGFEKISEPDSGQNFADKYVRFFPRSVVLGPNESQVIKMQLTKTSELKAGEYRSHLYFRAVPGEKPLGEETQPVADSSGISVRLTPVFGISIPVIIRVGASDTRVELSDLSLDMISDTTPQLNMVFNRSGNMSVYGNITVDHISPAGKVTKLSSVKGLAVYTPVARRQIRVKLNKIQGMDYHSGTLKVTYTAPAESNAVKIAEATLALQ